MKNVPNILTILRLLACPLLIFMFTRKTLFEIDYVPIFIIFVLASLTDFFDGYLAKKGNFKSNFGKVLDPIADKALIVTMCIMILNENALKIEGLHAIPLYIIILREIIVLCLRLNLSKLNKNIDVNLLSKYKTFIQILTIAIILIIQIFPYSVLHERLGPMRYHPYDLYYILESIKYFMLWLAAFITFITGVQHFKTYIKLK